MVYAGLDLYKVTRPVPEVSDVPVDTSPLARYLLARLFDSWANPSAVRFLTWTLEDDATVTKRTAREIRLLCARLDQGEPTPLGLVAARTLEDVGHGHQVLAIGYERTAEGTVVVHTWDNNHAGVVTTLTVTPGEYGIVSNRRSNPYRGFFMHTYTPQSPPENLAAI